MAKKQPAKRATRATRTNRTKAAKRATSASRAKPASRATPASRAKAAPRPRTRTQPPPKDNLDRSADGVLATATSPEHAAEREPPVDALPTRHTVDTRHAT